MSPKMKNKKKNKMEKIPKTEKNQPKLKKKTK